MLFIIQKMKLINPILTKKKEKMIMKLFNKSEIGNKNEACGMTKDQMIELMRKINYREDGILYVWE